MAGQLLNTAGSRLLRSGTRPGAEIAPYRPPLRDLTVTAPSPPSVRSVPGVLRWPPRRWAWLDDAADLLGGLPAGITEAIDNFHTSRAETYTPDPTIPRLPSLLAEAEREWRRARRDREKQALVGVAAAIQAAAPDMYTRLGEAMAEAVATKDDAAYTRAATLAATVRPSLGAVEGQGSHPRRENLSPAAVEWVLGNPAAWWENPDAYRPVITATTLHDHPEWEPGCYTPAEVVANLTGARATRP